MGHYQAWPREGVPVGRHINVPVPGQYWLVCTVHINTLPSTRPEKNNKIKNASSLKYEDVGIFFHMHTFFINIFPHVKNMLGKEFLNILFKC